MKKKSYINHYIEIDQKQYKNQTYLVTFPWEEDGIYYRITIWAS